MEQIDYTYDRDGNRTSRTTSAGTETYVYTSGARLDFIERGGATVADFTYDAGARVTRIERGGLDLNLTYDADDHVVAIDEAVSGDRAEIDFDAMERRTGRRTIVGAALVAAVAFLTAPSQVQALESPHLVTDASTGAGTTGYVYDGEHALARYDASTGDEVYYLRDAMGSVIGLVDGAATGASTIHYDGFGNVRSSSGPLAALPAHGGPRFQGMWLDPEGLYYVRARTYDAETGRFITRDPIEGRVHRPESLSPYALSNANPYVYQDPTGLFSLRGTLTAAVARVNLLFTAVASQAQRFMRALQSVGRSVYGLVRGLPSLFRASRGGVQALGRGSTANLSTGTTLPRNLREHLAVEQVISNPTAGRVLPIRMTDSRWLASDGWVKMSQFVNSGGRAGPIQVHYVLNTITGAIDDLKIVLPGAR